MYLPDRKTAHGISKVELKSRALDSLPNGDSCGILRCKDAAEKEMLGAKVGKGKRRGDKAAAKLQASAS